jgi:hypothetical protein
MTGVVQSGDESPHSKGPNHVRVVLLTQGRPSFMATVAEPAHALETALSETHGTIQGQRQLNGFPSKDFGQEALVPRTMVSLHHDAFLAGMLGVLLVYGLLYGATRISKVIRDPRSSWMVLAWDLLVCFLPGGVLAAAFAPGAAHQPRVRGWAGGSAAVRVAGRVGQRAGGGPPH